MSEGENFSIRSQNQAGDEVRGVNQGDGITWDVATQKWAIGPIAGGAGYTRIQDEGVNQTQRQILNFIGPNVVAADDAGNVRTDVTINTKAVQAGGVPLAQEPAINFTGQRVTGADDAGNNRTNIQVLTKAIQDGGVGVADQPTLNFIGFTVADNPGNARTDVTAPAGAESAFDFVLNSRADLVAVVAPVADEFILPSGSYAVKTGFALNADEFMTVPAGNSVLMMGMGNSKNLQGNVAAPLLNVAANGLADLYNLTLTQNNAAGSALTCSGTLFGTQCRPTGAVDALAMAGGLVQMQGCAFGGRVSPSAGVMRLSNSDMAYAGATNGALNLAGVQACEVDLDNVTVLSSTASLPAVFHGSATTRVNAANCTFSTSEDSADIVELNGARSFQMTGGKLVGLQGGDQTRGVGISINGNVTEGIQLANVEMFNVSAGVIHTAGTVDRFTADGVEMTPSGALAIIWPSADLPSEGLSLSDCYLGNASLNGFTVYDDNVHVSGCFNDTGPLPQTDVYFDLQFENGSLDPGNETLTTIGTALAFPATLPPTGVFEIEAVWTTGGADAVNVALVEDPTGAATVRRQIAAMPPNQSGVFKWRVTDPAASLDFAIQGADASGVTGGTFANVELKATKVLQS